MLSVYKTITERLVWFNQKGYLQGVFWITLVSLVSNTNDIFMRLLGERIHPAEIVFFRFFFAALIMFPILLHYGKSTFATARPILHIIRALMGFAAVSLWCFGVTMAPLAIVSTIALTVPIFVLPLAYFILKENVGWQRTIATLVGFIGIIVIAWPNDGIENLWQNQISIGVMILILSAILFALSDILNKFMIAYEGMLAMLFYFALGTSIAGLAPAIYVWLMPTLYEFMLLFCLGFGGNMILYCLLKAFKAADVSALAPYRYLELIFAAGFGYLIWHEIPGVNSLLGAAIIIPATLSIAYAETKKIKKDEQSG